MKLWKAHDCPYLKEKGENFLITKKTLDVKKYVFLIPMSFVMTRCSLNLNCSENSA